MATWKGQHRVRGKDEKSNRAWVTDGDNGMYVTENEYHFGSLYQPPWDELP